MAAAGTSYRPSKLFGAMRTSTSLSLPPFTTTASWTSSFSLQISVACLRFAGTFISGACPEKLTAPRIVPLPSLPFGSLDAALLDAAALGEDDDDAGSWRHEIEPRIKSAPAGIRRDKRRRCMM